MIVRYVQGEVLGFISFDDVVLANGITVSDQAFIEIESKSTLALDGIFGMSFTAISAMHKTSVIDNLLAQNALQPPIFSFYLGNDKQHNELTWGGYDPSKFVGELNFAPLQGQQWTIALDGVRFGTFSSNQSSK